MARRSKPKGPTPVEATKHQDQRVNIPTQELRQFVEDRWCFIGDLPEFRTRSAHGETPEERFVRSRSR